MNKSVIESKKNLILIVSGGIGRNIFSTAVIRNLKKAYQDKNIFVVAGFPDIFFNNPNIKRVYGFNSIAHLFEDYIQDNKDTAILEVEPYRHPDYIAGNKHIVEAWCDLLNIECDNIYPDLYLTRNEQNMAKAQILTYKGPVILFQHTGGKIPDQANAQQQIASEAVMHRRNLREECVQQVVDQLVADGYTVGSVQAQNQFLPKGAEKFTFPLRAVLALVPYCAGIITIDSFLMHACAALKQQALCLFAGTSPERLGYPSNVNLRRNECSTPECHRPNSYAFDVQSNGALWDCPFSDACTDYSAETILKAYKDMKGEEYTNIVKLFKVQPQIIETNSNVCCDK